MRSGLTAILALAIFLAGCASSNISLDDPLVFEATKAGVEYGVALGTYEVLRQSDADELDAKFVEAIFANVEIYLQEGKITLPQEVEALLPEQYKPLVREACALAERLAAGKPSDPRVKEILLSAMIGGKLGSQSYQKELALKNDKAILAALEARHAR